MEEKNTSLTEPPVQQQVREPRAQQKSGKIEEKEKKAVEKMHGHDFKGRKLVVERSGYGS